MKREDMNKYLGEKVNVTFKDGSSARGTLGFTEEFSARYGFRKPNFFTIGNLDFKVSHVKNIYRI